MTIISEERYRPLGKGRFHPAGSVGDQRIAELVSSYKRHIAGAYASVSCDAIRHGIPAGRHMVSTKVDGEQWFLLKDDDGTCLISPNRKVVTGIEVTEEAGSMLQSWSGLLAGELYAAVDTRRPRVYDLHSLLFGGADAQTSRVHFAAFDLLLDGDNATDDMPFSSRARRIDELLSSGIYVHPADFKEVESPDDIDAFFRSRAVDGNAEGIVVRCDDGRIWKIKPDISIDAVVVGYTASPNGVHDLLLGLMAEDGNIQLIGRVDVGFSTVERRDIADRLTPLSCKSELYLTSRNGLPYKWLKPEVVVEITCHELLTHRNASEPVRRPRLTYSPDSGWTPFGKHPSISMRDAVFVRVRDDKLANPVDVRWSQITDLVSVGSTDSVSLPASEIIRREVYTKRGRSGMGARKVIVWRTNKDAIDPRYTAYAVMFTDYSPDRVEPLQTDTKTASTLERIMGIAEEWLDANTGRGWECMARTCIEMPNTVDACPSAGNVPTGSHALTISFARSTSPTFPIVRRRLDGFSDIGEVQITTNESDKESWFELSITGGLVEHFRRVTNLLSLVRRWKSTEVSLDGESLDKYGIDDTMNRIEEIRKCWMRRKSSGPAGCMKDTSIGCRCLSIVPSERYLVGAYVNDPQWYTVGSFDGKQVSIDKDILVSRIDRRKNGLLDCCPNFTKDRVVTAISGLPDVLSPDVAGYHMVFRRDDGAPAWVWPEHAPLPPRLVERRVATSRSGQQEHGVYVGGGLSNPISTAAKSRNIPPTTYSDICGQDQAVEAVRDMIELPMRHVHLFEAVGARAKPGGIILAGPPGTGKTLLARAVAGECGAHLEVVSGPELLNPYVGATEQALRDVFERARKNAPSLILFDELDSIAPSRSTADAHHQQTLVAQLLTLLDGLEGRSGISVLATTNRPKSIDPALRRPGRFDTVVWMKLPDEQGRAAILQRYLKPLRLDSSIDPETLAIELASMIHGASGADLEFLCQTAARICVKEAILSGLSPESMSICRGHIGTALVSLGYVSAVPDEIIPVVTNWNDTGMMLDRTNTASA